MTALRATCLACVALTLLLCPNGTAAQAPSAARTANQETADRIVAELSRTQFGVARPQWRAAVPSATWRDRRGDREHPAVSLLPQPRGLWCSMATDTVTGMRRDAIFYGLRTERPYECRLEHVRYLLEAPVGTQDLFDALAAAIDARFRNEMTSVDPSLRTPFAIAPEMMSVPGSPGYAWDEFRYWLGATQYVALVRYGPTVQVMSQSFILSEALVADRCNGPLTFMCGNVAPDTGRYGVDLLRWEVVNALRPIDPVAADVIGSVEGWVDQDVIEQAALRLLQARATAVGDQRAMLSLACDLVVRQLSPNESWRRDRPGLRALLPYGVRIESRPTDSLHAAVGFAEDVRRRRPGTRWGQLAFLHRLAAGWNDFPGGDEYRHVIAQGEAWLKQYPGSPLAITVMSHVARAYETWWSLSLAPEDDEFGFGAASKEQGEAARLQAIRWYERIMRDAPTSIEAHHARRVIVQITAGVDTGERGFFAIYL